MSVGGPPITVELIRSALAHIPANLPRDEWARVGMAIKSEFPDDTGLQLFTEWSASAEGHDAAGTRATWRSIKAGGGVKVGTLLHLAKSHGFALPKAQQPAHPPNAAESDQRRQQREQQRQAEQAAEIQSHADAAEQAAELWNLARTEGSSAYLNRKGVDGHGVRYGTDGWLLVPLRDGAGQLWNVQRIAPEPPSRGAEKLFLKGGRKSGLWHLIGSLEGADAVLVAEGYATGASLLKATGRPVAVAFDAGNLLHVARALRATLPDVRLVICGDDDAATEQRTGRNPGRQKAEVAAQAVDGAAVLPHGLPEGASDFNDLHQTQGLDAVRDQVEAAVAGLLAGQDGQAATAGAEHPERPRKRQRGRKAATVAEASAVAAGDPFTRAAEGVWWQGRDREGNPSRPLWVCSPLDVLALTRDQDGAGWGYLLSFSDPLGRARQWAMPARMLSGDGGEYRAALLNMGLRIGPSPTARNKLTEYLQTRRPSDFATCTDRIGWHEGDGQTAYVLPHETIGDHAERIVFQSESQMENTFRVRGDVADWRDRIGALCAGNSRLVFAVACAFAGPLLRPAGMESGGFHLRGDSSSGKTTALRVAASVFGGPSYMQRWRTTDNALEAMAAQHCDSLLILDELAQVEGKVAGECAYMLANEQSKARATRNGAPRARLSWRLLFLSAGELGLADHMAEGMKRARTGQEVRMADIPADAGAGLGAFENIRDFAGGAAFSSHLAREVGGCYGAPGRAWLEWLCENANGLGTRLRKMAGTMAHAWVPQGASGQVERVAARFALVGAAGELAANAGLTGWASGDSEQGARACFEAWLASRGGAGNGETAAMLRQVRGFIEAHGASRFAWLHRAAEDHAPSTLNRAGWRRMLNADGEPIKTSSQYAAEYGERGERMANGGEGVSVEYLISPEVFRAEVCKGFDAKAVCRVLVEHECLITDKGGHHMTRKTRVPGVGTAINCYCIPPRILELDL